jgi:putative ABC transport system permease protein
MDQIVTDLRYALRQLARSPGFTALAVFTLALGIGANTALFTVAEAILQRPRPGVGESSSLVWVAATSHERSRPTGLSLQLAERLRAEVPLFERVVTVRDLSLSLATGGEPVKVKGQAVSGGYFSMLRAGLSAGRGFTDAEEREGAPSGAHPVAVLNHQAWMAHFGGDPGIVGRPITVNGLPLTVVGVAAPGFNGAEHDDVLRALWVPASMIVTLLPEWRWMVDDPASSNFRVLARLRGVGDREQASAAVARLGAAIAAEGPKRPDGWAMALHDASAGIPAGGREQVLPLAILSTAVTAMVLLICCANVSNLLLARALGRQREIATRLSIGASRGRVVRQLLTESVVLGVVSGGAGLLLAAWGVDWIITRALPIPLDLSMDVRVVGASAALAVVTGLLFGLAPALHTTRTSVAQALRDAGTGGGVRRSQLQGMLVASQVALSLLLLTMSGLFLRSLDKAQRVAVGFDATPRILAVSVDAELVRYDAARTQALANEVLSRLRGTPGVESASLTTLLPLTEWNTMPMRAQRAPGAAPGAAVSTSYSVVRPDYFRTLGIPLVAGRDFTAQDDQMSAPVAIVSESFARQHLGIDDARAALGARVGAADDDASWATIVGVARDATVQLMQTPAAAAVYRPHLQQHSSALNFLVRSVAPNAAPLAEPVRAAIRAFDPALPIHRAVTLDRVRLDATREQRAGAILLAGFGALALVLAALGLHAVMLFSVRQRWREMGIRQALGASRRQVVSMVVGRGVQLTAVGAVFGLVLAFGAAQLLRTMLFGVAPTDAVTFAAVTLLLLGVAVLASWWPARRASQVDPAIAMRAD